MPRDLKADAKAKTDNISRWLGRVKVCTCAQIENCLACKENLEVSAEELGELIVWLDKARVIEVNKL